jgi:hypothetical protein
MQTALFCVTPLCDLVGNYQYFEKTLLPPPSGLKWQELRGGSSQTGTFNFTGTKRDDSVVVLHAVDWYRGYGASTPCAPRP